MTPRVRNLVTVGTANMGQAAFPWCEMEKYDDDWPQWKRTLDKIWCDYINYIMDMVVYLPAIQETWGVSAAIKIPN